MLSCNIPLLSWSPSCRSSVLATMRKRTRMRTQVPETCSFTCLNGRGSGLPASAPRAGLPWWLDYQSVSRRGNPSDVHFDSHPPRARRQDLRQCASLVDNRADPMRPATVHVVGRCWADLDTVSTVAGGPRRLVGRCSLGNLHLKSLELMVYKGYVDLFPDDVDAGRLMYDGQALVGQPGFWPAYFLTQSVEDEELVGEIWAVAPDVVRGMQDRLNDSSAWPVFEVELGDGAKLAVVYRNFDEDAGVDYLLVPGPDQECIRIAAVEGHHQGPGISWSELNAVARRQPDAGARSTALLLLAPMLGDVKAETSAAMAAIVTALHTSGADEAVESFAELIASDNVVWEPAQWRRAKDGFTICDGEESPRNPESPVSLAPDDLRTISRLLAG